MELNAVLGSLLRHGLTTLGGSLVASGIITAADSQAIIGGVVALGGVLLSLYNKKKK
jgi:hypothetical protein